MQRLVVLRSLLAFMVASALASLSLDGRAGAAEYLVSNASQIATRLASIQPGDTLVMANGTWTNQRISFAAVGTAALPITLRAQTPGGVILNGNSKINISGSYLVVDGLRFDGGTLADGDHIVEFRGSRGPAMYSRLSNSAIIDYNPPTISNDYDWVSLYGQYNRVDHNRFEGQNHAGVTVVVWRPNGAEDHHLIESNHFLDRALGNDNGFETIRIGDSSQSLNNSFTTVQNNLFERVDGEIEMISNKSGANVFQYNTFRESAGTLTLRHGNNNRVEGNFFLGMNKNGTGGIRVIGEGQTIVNNYIADVDDRAGGAISISAGVPSSALNQYYQVKDAMIANNTVVNVGGPAITFDDGLGSSGRTLLAEGVTIANNLLRSSGTAIFEGTSGGGWHWEGNIAFGGSLGPVAGNPGVTAVNPMLQYNSDGLWRPAANSPAINAAAGNYSTLVSTDMDGQARIGLADIGADEFSAEAIVRRPLKAGDVGPSWLTSVTPPGGGSRFFADGCAIQAEDFTQLLDPNADGDVWTRAESVDALAGESLRAPAGARVDLPAGSHDTLALYDVRFQQPGTYRAYYRGRGADGSSDSMYVPNNFNVDPTIQETLANTGQYQWENGALFTIDAVHVGVPLEFRIGKREQFADLDAFVFHLDQSLSAVELDALFDPVLREGDFNEDRSVDVADLLDWQTGFGLEMNANRDDGDANGDDAVDGTDFLIWQRQVGLSPTSAFAAAAVPEPFTAALIAPAICAIVLVRTSQPRSPHHGSMSRWRPV